MARYALVQNSEVVNVIEAESAFANSLNYDHVVLLDDFTPASIGYSYDGSSFTAPVSAVDLQSQQLANSAFGNQIIADFALLNDQRGLTANQKYQLAQNLSGVMALLISGDLKTTLAVLPNLPLDGVLLTQGIITLFQTQIQDYLISTGQ